MNQAEVRRKQAQTIVYIVALITFLVTARLTGYHGITYIACTLETYFFVNILVSGGVTDALSRILRLRNNKGQYKNAESMRRNSFFLQMLLGGIGTIFMFFTAEVIAVDLFEIQYSMLLLRILAPAVLLYSLSSLLTGYVRGEGAELAEAVTGLLRQFMIIGFSFLFCRILGKYGEKVSHLLGQENLIYMYEGAGFVTAVLLSELLVNLFLILIYVGIKGKKENYRQEGLKKKDTVYDSIRTLCLNRGSRTMILLSVLLPFPAGLMLLQRASGDGETVTAQYGLYLAGYVVLCAIPAVLISLMIIPVCGKTMSLIRKEEHRYAKSMFQGGVHAGIIFGAFATVFLAVMSTPLAEVICGNVDNLELVEKMIAGGSSILLFVVLLVYFTRILVLTGKKLLVLVMAFGTDIIFIVTVYLFLQVGNAGVFSLVYAGMLTTFALCIILGMLAYRQMRQRIDWLQIVIIPVAMSCVAGLFTMLLGKLMIPHLGNPFSIILCLLMSFALYFVGLLLLRNFREQELEFFPGGRLISFLGQVLKVL